MKLKISLVGLLLTFAVVTFAQEARVRNYGTTWFIQLGAGVQTPLVEDFKFDEVTDALTLAPNLSIGGWVTPGFGLRLKAQDGKFLSSLKYGETSAAYAGHSEDKYFNAHLDLMWNMCQGLGKPKAKRVFNFIPYIGAGWYMRDAIENSAVAAPGTINDFYPDAVNGLTLNAGLLFEFRLSRVIGLHIDLAGMVTPDDKLNGSKRLGNWFGNGSPDAVAYATAGLTFNFGQAKEKTPKTDYASLIDDLNNRINQLRAENDILSRRPEFCDPCPEVVAPVVLAEETVRFDPTVVVFRISSFAIDANQRINIFNTAQFVKNTGEKIKVIGYADKGTGSAAYNLRLSERRARAVAQELTSRYGISSDKIVVEWKGDTEQPFKENDWNRVVIMRLP